MLSAYYVPGTEIGSASSATVAAAWRGGVVGVPPSAGILRAGAL